MYCKNCGTKVSDSAFCENCGTAVKSANKVNKLQDDTQIKLNLKPEFRWGYKLIVGTINSVIWFGFIMIFLFIISLDSEISFESMFFSPGTSLLVLVLTLFVMIIVLLFQSVQYEYLDYNFYATKIEYKDGFINKTEKELKYKFIREIVMSENVFERMFNIGKIKIFTNAGSGVQNGITIHCVGNVREQYETAKKIFNEGTEE